MARVQDIRIRYSADTADLERSEQVLSNIGKEIDSTEKEVKRVNQQFDKQVGIIGQLEQEMNQLEAARRKAQDPKEVKKYNKALKETEGKLQKMKGQGGFGGLTSAAKGFGAAIAASISVGALASFAVHLSKTSIEMENLATKSKTVFGAALPQVEKWAKASAAAMGLSQAAAIGAATAMGDLLIPMGFTREEAAKMSTDMLGLAGALSEWSGGQRSAEEVAQILSKAMLGEREQLKELGIAISEADVQQRLLEKGQSKLTGTMLQQAKAIATQELIFEKSADAQAAFAKNGNTLARQQAELAAAVQSLVQALATKLLPVFKSIVGVASSVAKALGLMGEAKKEYAEDSLAVVKTTTREIDQGQALINKYDQLSSKTNKTAQDKFDLQQTAQELVNVFGSSVRVINDETGALEINRDEVLRQIAARKLLRSEQAQNLIAEKVAIEDRIRILSQESEIRNKAFQEISNVQGATIGLTSKVGEAILNSSGSLFEFEAAIQGIRNEINRTSTNAEKDLAELESLLLAIPVEFDKVVAASTFKDVDPTRLREINREMASLGINLEDLVVNTPNGDDDPTPLNPKKLKEAKDRIDPLLGSLEYFQKLLTKLGAAQKKVRIGSEAEAQIEARIKETKRILEILQSENIEPWELTGEEMNAAMMRGFRGRLDQAKEGMRKMSEEIAKEAEEGLRKAEIREFWEQQLDSGTEFAGQLFDTLGQIQEAAFAQRFARLEEMRAKELEMAGSDAEKREQIEAEFDARAETLRREQFEEEKQAAKQRAIIEGVLLVLKSVVAGGGIPGGIPAGLLAAAQVAAQVAIIDAATFAKGGFTGKGTVRDHTGERIAGVVHEDEFVFQKAITKKHLPEFTRVWKGEDPYKVFAPVSIRKGGAFNDRRIVGAIGSQTGAFRYELRRQNKLLREQNNILSRNNPIFRSKKRLWNG